MGWGGGVWGEGSTGNKAKLAGAWAELGNISYLSPFCYKVSLYERGTGVGEVWDLSRFCLKEEKCASSLVHEIIFLLMSKMFETKLTCCA